MASTTNEPIWEPYEDQDIEEVVKGLDEMSKQDFERQALHLIVQSRWEHETQENRMRFVAEAQVWATLATSREDS